jgi:hypothetical protein
MRRHLLAAAAFGPIQSLDKEDDCSMGRMKMKLLGVAVGVAWRGPPMTLGNIRRGWQR